ASGPDPAGGGTAAEGGGAADVEGDAAERAAGGGPAAAGARCTTGAVAAEPALWSGTCPAGKALGAAWVEAAAGGADGCRSSIQETTMTLIPRSTAIAT